MFFYRFYDTVVQVVLQYDFSRVIDSGAHCRKLDQDIAAVGVLIYHTLYCFQVSDRFREPVHNCLLLFPAVDVAGLPVRMSMAGSFVCVLVCMHPYIPLSHGLL